jgi:hypothetical protein
MKVGIFFFDPIIFFNILKKERKYEPIKMPSKKKPLDLNESSTSSNKVKKLNLTPAAPKKVTIPTHQGKVNTK